MDDDGARANVLAVLRYDWKMSVDAIAGLCSPDVYGPDALSDAERAALSRDSFDAPDHARADVPEWLWPSFQRAFGANAMAEGQALAMRAPVDLRVNTLKADREKALKGACRV